MKRAQHYNTLESYTTKKNDGKPNHPYHVERGDVQPPAQPLSTKQELFELKSGGLTVVDSKKVYNLITNPQYNTRNGVPIKIMLICSADWCNPCKLLLPKLEDLTTEPSYRNISFLKVDCTDTKNLCPELRNLLNIGAVPTMYAFNGGKQIDMVAGSNITEIENLCERLATL